MVTIPIEIKQLARRIGKFVVRKLLAVSMADVVLYDKTRQQALDMGLIRRLRSAEGHLEMVDNEAYNLIAFTRAVKKVPGQIVEVGTYMGRSAKLMAKAEADKLLFTFDTFEGLPELGAGDVKARFAKGQFKADFREVRKYLLDCPNVSVVKGTFPQSGGVLDDLTFSFVHLDVDLYAGTLDSLKFLYPKMSRGGAILVHDYLSPNNTSVFNAVNEFFADKLEPVFELGGGSQCVIIKL